MCALSMPAGFACGICDTILIIVSIGACVCVCGGGGGGGSD